MLLFWVGIIFWSIWAQATTLVGIPTFDFNQTSSSSLQISDLRSITVDSRFENSVDNNGETLIPPTLTAFAHTFASDFNSVLGIALPVRVAAEPVAGSIFLTLAANETKFLDAAGRLTSEGYSLSISQNAVIIAGSSPLGVWWGTRTLLQQAKLGKMQLPIGSGSEAPGWGTRGVMLDAGRHYYPPSFLISLCSYMSFFKQNTFHLHLSDNLNNNVDIYTRERSLELYAAFRLNSNDSAVAGLVRSYRMNETYSRDDFEAIQQQCASRGVTVIPEIEAPGHALVITQWKPELGLPDLSLLNITHPETIPTMQAVWATFLPWFHSKSVHIGADEYDSSLADDYNLFVDNLAGFIANTSSKNTRIWGTNEPGKKSTVNKEITIQHWEFFEDNPLSLIESGYKVLNSDDAFYIVGKWSGSYPQTLNNTRIFHGNPAGGAWAPFVFDTSNSSNNPSRDNPMVVGHLAAQWNDFGMNATTVSEAWYSWRDGLAALADKQWGGKLTMEQYMEIFPSLHIAAPGQNLDKTVLSKTDAIFHYEFTTTTSKTVKDMSGNAYDGLCVPACNALNGAIIFSSIHDFITTPLSTKGRNYTLSFSANISSSTPIGSTIFSGADSALQHGNGTVPNLMLITSSNQPYALNLTLPTDKWIDVSLVGRGNGTFLSLDQGVEHEFLATLGISGESFVWAPIAIEAPIAKIGGFIGSLAHVSLKGSA
ncbi:beta-hexosaminidase [Mycena floridula]|nr:beta-hexosaminidase [Mycena floridula]